MVLGRSSGQVAELHEIRFEAASLMARIYAEQVANLVCGNNKILIYVCSHRTNKQSPSFVRCWILQHIFHTGT